MSNILIDTGFWFALYNKGDQHYNDAQGLIKHLSIDNIIIPYPTLYETVNTRFVEKKENFREFKRLLKQDNFEIIDDAEYKEGLLEQTFDAALKRGKTYSIVDKVIRRILDDDTVKIDYLLTFNIGDFVDVCQRRNIRLLWYGS